MKIIKTFSILRQIDEQVALLYQANPLLRNTKFGYVYKRFYEKNYFPLFNELQDKIADEKLNNALVDEKTKEVLYTDSTQRAYKFDKEGTRKVIEFIRKIYKDYEIKEVEVFPFISNYIPKELNEEQKELFKGLII